MQVGAQRSNTRAAPRPRQLPGAGPSRPSAYSKERDDIDRHLGCRPADQHDRRHRGAHRFRKTSAAETTSRSPQQVREEHSRCCPSTSRSTSKPDTAAGGPPVRRAPRNAPKRQPPRVPAISGNCSAAHLLESSGESGTTLEGWTRLLDRDDRPSIAASSAIGRRSGRTRLVTKARRL
jgi:hypothetical protein